MYAIWALLFPLWLYPLFLSVNWGGLEFECHDGIVIGSFLNWHFPSIGKKARQIIFVVVD